MSYDDILEMIPADPMSHYRLRECQCGSDHAAYVQKADGRWAVRCFDCGKESQEADCRHGAQQNWNKGGNTKGETL